MRGKIRIFGECGVRLKKGFYIWSIERGFSNKYTGRVVQLDIIFINKNA